METRALNPAFPIFNTTVLTAQSLHDLILKNIGSFLPYLVDVDSNFEFNCEMCAAGYKFGTLKRTLVAPNLHFHQIYIPEGGESACIYDDERKITGYAICAFLMRHGSDHKYFLGAVKRVRVGESRFGYVEFAYASLYKNLFTVSNFKGNNRIFDPTPKQISAVKELQLLQLQNFNWITQQAGLEGGGLLFNRLSHYVDVDVAEDKHLLNDFRYLVNRSMNITPMDCFSDLFSMAIETRESISRNYETVPEIIANFGVCGYYPAIAIINSI